MPRIINARPNARDSTLRNTQAANKKLAQHARWIRDLQAQVADLQRVVFPGGTSAAPDEPLGPEIVPGEPWR